MKCQQVIIATLCLSFSTSAVAAEQSPAVKAVNHFAAAHHRRLPAGNVLTSPWSVQTTLAIVCAGAAGTTRQAMQKAFSLEGDEPALYASFQALQQALLAKPGADVPMDIRTSNRLFVEQTLKLQPDWLEVTRRYFTAEAGRSDFSHDATGESTKINDWVGQQTNGKITGIIPPGTLDHLTLMVLVNAVYFDLPWDEQFTKSLTTDQPFYVDATHVKTVPLMFKQHALRYTQKPGFQIAALSYAGEAYQFVVILPDSVDGLAVVETQLTGDLLSECITLPRTEVRLSLPRIAMSPPVVSLKQTLSALGAGEMFDVQKADFSRMIIDANKLRAHVSDVFHRTFIELDEDGTKAAAATAGVVRRMANGVPHAVPHKVVKADHPFLFMIQHVQSGACLFLGRMTDPAHDSAAQLFPVTRSIPKK